MRSAFLLTPILLFCFNKSLSQGQGKFHISYYTTENGLPSNGIKGLQWDEQNSFLWIATEAGISRFNGWDFKNFTVTNTPFITSERMLFIVKNNKGGVYASDQNGNLCYVRNNNLVFYKRSNDEERFTITVSDTLFNNETEYTGKPFVLTYDQFIPSSDTSCFIIHANKLYKYSAGHSDVITYPDSSRMIKNGFQLQGRIFFIDEHNLVYELNNDRLESGHIRFLAEEGSSFDITDKNNHFFWVNGMKNPVIINKNKAWTLRLSQNNIIAISICDEIPTDALIVHVQYEEQKKILILGTRSKGIIVLTQNRVNVMRDLTTPPNEPSAYYAQVELPGNMVLTNEGHIIGRQILKPASLPIEGKFSNQTNITNDSLLWYTQLNTALGYGCLHKHELKTGKTSLYPKVRDVQAFVFALSNGQFLLATDHGIAKLVHDSMQYLYRHKQVTYNTLIYKIEEIQPGIVLLATCTGILKFNITEKKLDTLLNTNGYCVRSSWKYNDYIFFGSYGKGFFIWKNGVLKSMPVDKRQYLLYAHCFIPDNEGFCWISTNRGLFKVRIDELINAYENNSSTVYYHYYGKNDGMDIIEMNGGCNPCALQLRDKTLSFPTMDGLLWVDPEKSNPVLPDGEIFIDEMIADSIKIDPDQTEMIELSAKTKDIIVRLGFSAWCNKENIYIDYQLNDTLSWRPVNTDADARIQLSNLSPGEYVLRFRKSNGFGVNNYSFKTIRFSIMTPWYKTWGFSVLIVLAIAALILLYVNIRTRQLKQNQLRLEKLVSEKTRELQMKNEVLEKNDNIKTRLISIISHDIVTPLKFLTAAGKNLIEKRKVMPEELQNETLEEMANTSQELQMLSTNILNWIKYQNENMRLVREHFNLHELVDQVIGILRSLARSKNLALKNQVDAQLTLYQYVEPLKILIYNLLTNAINFSERGEIIIGSEKENEFLKIWVKDDGRGMTQDQIQHLMADEIIITSANADKRKGHGLGYLIIKDLLKMTGGTVSIQSERGKGSTISILLPANQKNHLGE